jgi:dipeptidase
MKVEINGSMLDARLYDRDNGPGAAKRVVDRLRAKPAEANATTDEERLGLPEEPEAYAKIEPLRAWGAAWREKALELEKRAVNAEAGDVPETSFGNSATSLASSRTPPAASSPDQAQDPSDPCK